MMKTILIVNGEKNWADYFGEAEVVQKKIQTSDWVLKEDTLYVTDADGVCQPDAILWRVGAIKPDAKHRTALEIIRMSDVPCVNSAECLLQGYDRLSMLQTLQRTGLPVIPFHVASATHHLKNITMPYPFVVKAGNYHGGFGKVIVQDDAKWQDIRDMLFISSDYVTVEPYIDYERDIRYLAIGGHVRAMSRKGKFWKANTETLAYAEIEPDPELVVATKKLQAEIGADILAIDVLEEKNGNRYIVEYNDIPGLSGWDIDMQLLLAELLLDRIK